MFYIKFKYFCSETLENSLLNKSENCLIVTEFEKVYLIRSLAPLFKLFKLLLTSILKMKRYNLTKHIKEFSNFFIKEYYDDFIFGNTINVS